MAAKRTRADSTNTVTPNLDAVITPIETVNDNKYESVLQRLQELEEQNKALTKKVAEANNDISEQVKQSKRKYGFNLDGSRNPDELFKYRYRTLIDGRVEKAVTETKTIGRPVNVRNNNNGKWTNIHDVEVFFHDGSKIEMDILDYINQSVLKEDFAQDSDKKVIDGKTYVTFHTENFGTFTAIQQ